MDHSGLTTLLKLFVKGALQYVKLFKFKMYPFWRKYRPSLLTLFGKKYRPSLLTLFEEKYRLSLVVVVVKKKDKSGRISSDKDLMIEIDWKHTVIQSSATVLCLSNYRESFVNLATIDVKTRRKINLKNFQL